jgi:hypothetical protein
MTQIIKTINEFDFCFRGRKTGDESGVGTRGRRVLISKYLTFLIKDPGTTFRGRNCKCLKLFNSASPKSSPEIGSPFYDSLQLLEIIQFSVPVPDYASPAPKCARTLHKVVPGFLLSLKRECM